VVVLGLGEGGGGGLAAVLGLLRGAIVLGGSLAAVAGPLLTADGDDES
jgi:hypothetical protein